MARASAMTPKHWRAGLLAVPLALALGTPAVALDEPPEPVEDEAAALDEATSEEAAESDDAAEPEGSGDGADGEVAADDVDGEATSEEVEPEELTSEDTMVEVEPDIDVVATGEILDAVAIVEIVPEGPQVSAVALEYDVLLDLESIDVGAFEVAVDIEVSGDFATPISGTRTVARAYSSAAPSPGQWSTGNWVVIELDSSDGLGGASYYNVFTEFVDLAGAYEIQQVAELEGADGVIPAQDAAVLTTGARTLVVDDYEALEYTGTAGATVPYRFFEPQLSPGVQVPLVVSLHGHGESGSDNYAQVAGNQISVAFADPARQAGAPAYVLSPQAGRADPGQGGWWDPATQEAVIELVRQTMEQYPGIDPERIYLTGLSMGAYGSWAILPTTTDLFAAAVLVCGAGDEETALNTLSDLPIWALHSVDDFVVPYDAPGSGLRILRAFEDAGAPVVWSEWDGNAPRSEQELAAANARLEAAATGARHLFTTFPAGTTPVNPHASWVPTYANSQVLDWLFEQRLDVPPAPEPTPEPEPEPEPEPSPEPEPTGPPAEDATDEPSDVVEGSPAPSTPGADPLPATGAEPMGLLMLAGVLSVLGAALVASRARLRVVAGR